MNEVTIILSLALTLGGILIAIIGFFIKRELSGVTKSTNDTNVKVTNIQLDMKDRPTYDWVSDKVKEDTHDAHEQCATAVKGMFDEHRLEYTHTRNPNN